MLPSGANRLSVSQRNRGAKRFGNQDQRKSQNLAITVSADEPEEENKNLSEKGGDDMQVTAHIRLDDESSAGNSQRGAMKLLNISMASPSNGDTSMADFSMASISMGDAGSSDREDDRSSRSNDSGTAVVRVDKKKPKAVAALANLKVNTLDKLDEVEGEEDA